MARVPALEPGQSSGVHADYHADYTQAKALYQVSMFLQWLESAKEEGEEDDAD